jgi:hypothetical protein
MVQRKPNTVAEMSSGTTPVTGIVDKGREEVLVVSLSGLLDHMVGLHRGVDGGRMDRLRPDLVTRT